MSEEMSKRELALFNLGKSLVELLGEELAIANLTLLYQRHPEMFVDEEELKRVIQKVVSSPDIIVKNPTPMSEKDYIAGKKLNEEKMGEVGIRRDGDSIKIYHANHKRLKNLDLLAKKEIIVDGRDAHTPYTQAQSLDGRLVENNISSTTNAIIPHTKQQLQQELDKQLKSYLTAPSQHHRERHLANANAIAIKAKDNNITLDSASLQKLKQYNNNEKNLSKPKGLHK